MHTCITCISRYTSDVSAQYCVRAPPEKAGQFRFLHAEGCKKESCHHHLHSFSEKKTYTPASEIYTLVALLGQWQMWRSIKARNSPVEAIQLLSMNKYWATPASLPDHCSILKSILNITDSYDLFLKFLCTSNSLSHQKGALLSPFTGISIGSWQGKSEQKSEEFEWDIRCFSSLCRHVRLILISCYKVFSRLLKHLLGRHKNKWLMPAVKKNQSMPHKEWDACMRG